MNNEKFYTTINKNFSLIISSILLVNFLIKLLLYFNTLYFDVSEAKSNFSALEELLRGNNPDLFIKNYRAILAYIAFFFIKYTGSLTGYFIFQALIGTLTVFILYKILDSCGCDKLSTIITLFLITIFLDFHLLTPVFYYQQFEIFFTVLIIFLLFKIYKDRIYKSIINILILIFITYISIFFRDTLKYIWFILIMLSIYFYFDKNFEKMFVLFSGAIFLLFLMIFIPPYKLYENKFTKANDFVFYGHTLYGGHGGEGAFIYERNKIKYESELNKYLIENNIPKDSLNQHVINNFQKNEIKKFIYKYPHQWILLQIKKVLFTYSIIPIKDNLKILMTGKIRFNYITSTVLLLIPYILAIILFIFLVTFYLDKNQTKSPFVFTLFLFFIYLITATSIYGHYSERYRTVVFIGSIFPLIGYYINFLYKFNLKRYLLNIRFYLFIFILLLLISTWIYQILDVFYFDKDRYFNEINKF